MALVKHGVPFDVAFALQASDAMAYAICFGELEGETFNWDSLRWQERK